MAVFLDEILLHIFGYLDAATLTKLSSVCKQWRNIAHTPSLWRRLILLRWPSQKFLFQKVSLSCVNWMKTYQDMWLRGNFSPDDMKYFIFCRVGGDELTVTELREAMFLHMAEVMMKWDIPDVFEQDGGRNAPNFNKSFELFFDTHDLKWTFIDKRREYIDDLFSCKLKTTKLQARYIRPYQVIPSCLMMFRWLCLFRTHVTDETGLTFYRIWRYRLKHRKTGLNFEVFDWKAAMSCTLSNGSPTTAAFREDALELLNVLTHPNFIMHPMGVSTLAEFGVSPPGCIRRCNSATSSHSSCGLTGRQSPIKAIGEFDKRDFKARHRVASSTTDSDDESDGGYDTGYVTNCEDFISSNHWDVEEQHKIQAEVAGMWTVLQNDEVAHLFLNFDLNAGDWVFHDCVPTFPEFWIQGGAGFCLHYSNHKDHGYGIEPIPSCLALYRLVCLMNINARVYASMAEASIWALHLIHNTTRAVVHLKDLNGWFVVSVTLTEDMQNQLRKTEGTDLEKQTIQWCEASTPLPTVDTQYVAGDEGSDVDYHDTDDVICETPTQLSGEECYSSSEISDVECDDLQEEFWLTRLTPKQMSKERQFNNTEGSIEDGACAISDSSHWQSHEASLYQGLQQMSDVENPEGAWGEGAWGVSAPFIDQTDDYSLDTDFEFAEVISSLQEVNNNPSDSEASEVCSANIDQMSTFEQFKHDVRTLLNLVMDEKFAHPYGTIAGSVA